MYVMLLFGLFLLKKHFNVSLLIQDSYHVGYTLQLFSFLTYYKMESVSFQHYDICNK